MHLFIDNPKRAQVSNVTLKKNSKYNFFKNFHSYNKIFFLCVCVSKSTDSKIIGTIDNVLAYRFIKDLFIISDDNAFIYDLSVKYLLIIY